RRSTLSVCARWLFFFSSRRRHTRLVSDWSSDVCSSDLPAISDNTNRTRNRTKSTCAIWVAAPAIPPKPSTPAMIAITRNVNAQQIGRASCRERVEISVGGVPLKKKQKKDQRYDDRVHKR